MMLKGNSKILQSLTGTHTVHYSVFKDAILILQGSLIQAIGYTVFLIPNKIITGGLYGPLTAEAYL